MSMKQFYSERNLPLAKRLSLARLRDILQRASSSWPNGWF